MEALKPLFSRNLSSRMTFASRADLTTIESFPNPELQSVPQEKVRVYSESFEENLIFLFCHNSAHKALGRTHLINRPIAVVLDNGLTPSGHALD